MTSPKQTRRGRPGYPAWCRDLAETEYLKGLTPTEIAETLHGRGVDINPRTIRGWAKSGKWDERLAQRRETPENLDDQIARLAAKQNMSYADTLKLANLSRARQRLAKLNPKPKPKPRVLNIMHKDKLADALSPDYGLYTYQHRFLTTEARFNWRLKCRQSGFSWVVALKMLLKALTGRKQLCISASQRQATNVLRYVRDHADRLNIPIDDENKESVVVAGVEILALPPNARTIQGFAGDVIFDEFAWVRNQKHLWEAVIPSITACGGTVDVLSTPFLPGSHFWKLTTNHEGRFSQWSGETLTIHDCINEGMQVPGGIDELRSLFDLDSWAMMYECQWAEDGTALLSWKELEAITDPKDYRIGYDGFVRIGIDVGRVNDRTVIILIGETPDGLYVVLDYWELQDTRFDEQKNIAINAASLYPLLDGQCDATGIGAQLAEDLALATGGKIRPHHFTNDSKARVALNLQELVQKKLLRIPNDPGFMASLHAVQKIAGANSIRYDAARTKDGHADHFWALGLAVDGLGERMGGQTEVDVW